MNYKVTGAPLPVVTCTLEQGEAMKCEAGSMSWMTPNILMQTSSNGGFGKVLSRSFTGERLFQNVYTCQQGQGIIAFASSFPGDIVPVKIEPNKAVVCQKSAYLASTMGVDLSIHFQKKLGAGFFGGEGFIMQKLSGNGMAFLEVDGSATTYTLAPGQQMIIDTGYLVMADETVKIDIQSTGGLKNALFGGEGLFNTIITGPGHIWLQTMPLNNIAGVLAPYLVTGK